MIMCSSDSTETRGERPDATVIRPPPRNRGVHIISATETFP